MTSEMHEPADARTSEAPREPAAYPHKASFYQSKADTERMRAAYLNTKGATGYGSLSEFICAAINEKVAGLEETHNEGHPWEPLVAGRIPRGKPVSLAADDADA